MTIQKKIYTILLLLSSTLSQGQTEGWTKDAQEYYQTLTSLCAHFNGKTYDTSQRDIVFNQFVYFDNILSDSSKTRIQQRTKLFDALFYQLTHFIDSVGIENLDAKPTRHFKDNTEFFKPYNNNGELHELLPLTLTYFDKRRPTEPIGTLLFEPKTHKLLAWVMVNQGGYRYFLTFNLV